MTSSTHCLDLSLSNLAEKLGLNDNWLRGKESLSQNFEVSCLGDVDDGHSVLIVNIGFSSLLGDEGPYLIEVDAGEVESVLLEGEGPDTLLAEVAWMVSIHSGSIVGEATSVTPTSRMLSVFANSSSSTAHRTSQLSTLSESGSHILW